MFDTAPLEVKNSLPDLAKAISNGKIIKIKKGRWIALGWYSRFVSWIRGDHHLSNVIKIVNRLFDKVETGCSLLYPDHCKDVGKALYRRISKYQHHKAAAADLKGRLLSFKYRIQGEKEFSPFDLCKLVQAAKDWQKQSLLFAAEPITNQDTERLMNACRYPKFIQHVLSNSAEQDRFFRWVIRHRLDSGPYVLFRSTTEKLTESLLSNRIGYYGTQDLKVKKEGNQAILTLPMNGIDRNILDGSRSYTLTNTYTVKQIFKIFKDRWTVIGDLEYFGGSGIIDFNPKRMGPHNPLTGNYDTIDLTRLNWWEQLRPVARITNEEASQRFQDIDGNKIRCNGTNWVCSIMATTDRLNIDGLGNHAYFQAAISTGDGYYNIYPFGKFAENYPITPKEKKKVAFGVVRGVIVYPEENIFNLDRLTDGISWDLTPKQGMSRMESLRKDILNGQNNNLTFQLFNGNCIMWCFEKMHTHVTKEQVKELAGVRFLDATPSGALGWLWSAFRLYPENYLEPSLTWVLAKFGADEVFIVTKKNGKKEEVGLLKKIPWKPDARFPHPTGLVLGLQKRRKSKNSNLK